jgi:hypothetical protein
MERVLGQAHVSPASSTEAQKRGLLSTLEHLELCHGGRPSAVALSVAADTESRSYKQNSRCGLTYCC